MFPAMRKKIINELMKKTENAKVAADMVKDGGLNPEEFPDLLHIICRNSANYFISRFFRPIAHPDHLPLFKVEEMF